uniref:Uncharacterized protein LOC117346065 isoform X2 n=1 Tax=Geotrypetes seraphini TaxID=260995 RepID=A0A6P8NQK4_GEOSA|nr:uncharacterized protein LOC117346065 isoform X2 [Geotrypetes seraphini]
MSKSRKGIARAPLNRCAKEKFNCQGWETSREDETNGDDFQNRKQEEKCTFLDRGNIVLSSYREDSLMGGMKPQLPNVTDQSFANSSSLQMTPVNYSDHRDQENNQNKTKSQHRKLMHKPIAPINKEPAKDDFYSSKKIKRVIYLTHVRNQLLKTPIVPNEKVSLAISNSTTEERASTLKCAAAPAFLLCCKHQNVSPEINILNRKDSQCGLYKTVNEGCKEAILKLRVQTREANLTAPSRNVSNPTFHDTIQQCISELPTDNSNEVNRHEISGEEHSAHIGPNSKTLSESEMLSAHCHTEHTSLAVQGLIMSTDPSNAGKCHPTLEMKKYAPGQQCHQTVNVITRRAQIMSANIDHVIVSGKEHAPQIKNTFGFPAFHPNPLKIPFYQTIVRTQAKKDQRNVSSEKGNCYSENLLSQPSENKRELIPPESHVTLGHVLHVMREDLKQGKYTSRYNVYSKTTKQ